MMFAGIFRRLVAPYDPWHNDFGAMLAPPSLEHWCGTDAFGRDIFSRIIYGARTALIIGFTSSFVGCTLGAVLGVASAYFGGKVDTGSSASSMCCCRSRIIVLALVVVAVLPQVVVVGIDINLIVAIAIPIVPRVARVVRAAALSMRGCPMSMRRAPPAIPTPASSSATWRRTWWRPT